MFGNFEVKGSNKLKGNGECRVNKYTMYHSGAQAGRRESPCF